MIEKAAYESNELIHKIRSEHGTRKTSERTSDVGTPLQDELRSSERESRSASGIDIEGSSRGEGDSSGFETNEGTPKRRDSREGRTDSTLDKSDGGSNSHFNAIGRAFQRYETNSRSINEEEEKPSGLYAKPHARERHAREQTRQTAEPFPSNETKTKAGFFGWLRPDNRGKSAKETKPRKSKGKPLTEAQIEQLRPQLVEALQDALPLLDQVVLATNKAHAKPYIWGSLDNVEDSTTIANWWLKKARVSGEMAQAAQQLISYHDDVEILIMVVPMFGQTFDFYRQNGGFTLRGR